MRDYGSKLKEYLTGIEQEFEEMEEKIRMQLGSDIGELYSEIEKMKCEHKDDRAACRDLSCIIDEYEEENASLKEENTRLREANKKVFNYCLTTEPKSIQAATVMAILLDCDFRESEQRARAALEGK